MFLVRFTLSCLLLLASATALAGMSPTEKLHRLLLTMDMTLQPIVTLESVQTLIQEGADPHAQTITGGNSFNLAIDGFSYLSGTPDDPKLLAAKDIAVYLAGLGVDTNALGERGLTPLYILLRFGTNNALRTEMINLILSRQIDLNLVNREKVGLLYLLSSGSNRAEFMRLLDSGLSLTTVATNGLTFAHLSAQSKSQPLLLQALMQRLAPETQREFAAKPAHDLSRPIHWAAHSNNLAAIQYLVEQFQVDVNVENQEGDTALSIAQKRNFPELVRYLLDRGARSTQSTTELSCTRANTVDFDYEKLKQLIEQCQLRTIDAVLPLLPVNYRSNYLVVYGTLAVQGATPDFPQIVTFGKDGKMIMAFNGHHSQRGYRNLEVIQFRDDTKTFEFRDIEFPHHPEGTPKFSAANPVSCLGCHGQKPRPLWDNWTFWPGKFGAEMSTKTPKEVEYWSRFMQNRNSGRYQHLPELSFAPITTAYGPIPSLNFQNSKFDFLMDGLMPQKITREIKEAPALSRFRYAIMASVSCSEAPDAFLPPSVSQSFRLNFTSLREDTRRRASQEHKNRVMLTEQFLGTEVTGRYVVQLKYAPDTYSNNQAGRNFDIDRTTRLRYLAENQDVETSDWFTSFNLGRPSYSVISLSGLEDTLWRELLDPVADAELYAKYDAAFKAKTGGGFATPLFYMTPQEAEVCSVLKAKSLSILQ